MSRFKFRAWDTNNRRMIGNWLNYAGWRNLDNMEHIWNVRRYIIEQWTGLTDKNGREIYEGDVVVDRWANEYTPVFQNGIYMAYNPKHLTQNGPSTQFNVIWKDGCEVIGNIHEREGKA